jgi:hypothetical protein
MSRRIASGGPAPITPNRSAAPPRGRWLALATLFVELHGPGGQGIYVAPTQVTSIREPLASGHFARGVHCLVYLSNRNFVTVTETCDAVRLKLSAYP